MVTLAAIFRQHGPAYQASFASHLPSHKQAMRAIVQCRTAALGGHVYTCDACHHVEYRYHSCRNRHCPQCQGDKAQQWLTKQQAMLLPVPYFLLTFTLPAELRPLARSRQKRFYNLLFRTAAAATQQLAQNPRWLGGQIGMIGILHTWGRTLAYHPHVHFLVPAGVWDGQLWRPCRHPRFFLPSQALSRLFRAKFRDALKPTPSFALVPTQVWHKEWVVDCRPVGQGKRALRYLAGYVFRVAIANSRLVSVTTDQVSFRYRPSGSRRWRLCSLSPLEFMRRFLQHVLPKGFVKVRYYGFFSPGQRHTLALVRDFLTPHYRSATPKTEPDKDKDKKEATAPTPGWLRCPLCGHPLQRTRTIPELKQRWQPP